MFKEHNEKKRNFAFAGGTTVVAQQQATMMNPVGYAPSPYSAGYDQP